MGLPFRPLVVTLASLHLDTSLHSTVITCYSDLACRHNVHLVLDYNSYSSSFFDFGLDFDTTTYAHYNEAASFRTR